MTFPLCNQADLFTAGPRVMRGRRRFDAEGYERTQRRNGAYRCPKCGLWWPVIEEPCEWVESRYVVKEDGPAGALVEQPGDAAVLRMRAVDWGRSACEMCQLLMVVQPDGTPEVYQL